MDETMRANVFNIQRNSIHDGPGIRTTVFFKGCPLRCRWCCNPESWRTESFVYSENIKCIHCGKCVAACTMQAIITENEKQVIEYEKCMDCTDKKCVQICPSGALSVMGREMSVEDIWEEVKRDIVFYGKGRGGITASGGEPLLHAEFIRTLFEYCHAHNITTAIETCLCVGKEQVREVLEVTDYVMCDYKHWNKEKFYQWTGGNLDIIEENLADILSSKKDVVVRIPLIPDFNADKETIQRMCKKLSDFGAEKIELLPYHRLGKIKYENMNMSYQMKDDRLLPEELIRELKSIPESM